MMAEMLLSTIAEETGGKLSGDVSFSRVSTDTRNIQRGDIFVALSGDSYDGNQFVDDALKKGASAAVVSTAVDCEIPQLLVDDSRVAYGIIARTNRRLFSGRVIGLTGSSGKTTCKEMVAAILSECGPVLSTKNNFNNEVGVPLTLLAINPEHQYAVIEMGASAVGDIRYLTQFVEPEIALVTNAMAVHLEGFGDIDSVAKTKGEIYEGLPATGTAVINKDDYYFNQWVEQAGDVKVVSFSKDDAGADFYAENIQIQKSGTTRFDLRNKNQKSSITLRLFGEHNITNAIAASAVAVSAGADFQQVKMGLEKILPVPGRLQTKVLKNLTVIDDTYNASPASVKAAIDVLAAFQGKRSLVLGTMGELGEKAKTLHQEVAIYAKDKGIDQLLAVGEFSEVVVTNFGGPSKSFTDMAQLVSELNLLKESDVVLVKGSRSAHMERFVKALTNNEESGGSESDGLELDGSELKRSQPAIDRGDT